jgi:hypothetical protein
VSARSAADGDQAQVAVLDAQDEVVRPQDRPALEVEHQRVEHVAAQANELLARRLGPREVVHGQLGDRLAAGRAGQPAGQRARAVAPAREQDVRDGRVVVGPRVDRQIMQRRAPAVAVHQAGAQ